MATPRDIKHEGRITAITEKKVTVTILAKSACASCETKGLCSSSEMKDKEIEIDRVGGQMLRVGEMVNVAMTPSMGSKAVLFGYVLPLFFLVGAMAVSSYLFNNEGVVGLSALASVAIYYFILWLFRDKLNSTFVFRIERWLKDDISCNI